MLNPHEAMLESKMERIARIITREYGVNVRVEGGRAYVDLDTREIVIPNLKGDFLGTIERVLDGFLDHECAHILYTDGALVDSIKKMVVLFDIWNGVEDCWVEREHSKIFPGVAQNLKVLHEAVYAENKKHWDQASLIPKLRAALIHCWCGGAVLDDFYSDPLIGNLLKLLEPEFLDGFNVKATKEAISLARRIVDKLRNFAQQQLVTQSKKADQISQELQGDLESKDASLSGRDAGISSDQGTESNGKVEKENQSQFQDILNELEGVDYKPLMDPESLINNLLSGVPYRDKKSDPEEYLVFSNEFDTDTFYTSEQKLSWSQDYAKLREEVSDYIGTMGMTLALALSAEAESRWVGGARRGRKFDRRVFPLWTQGGRDDRIYRQKEQNEDWDVAVSLLWDCSGSMGSNTGKRSKSYLARLAAIAFHEALTPGIMHEVLGFNTGGGSSATLAERINAAVEGGEDVSKYSRTVGLDNRMVFVPWGSSDGRAICAIDGWAANRDGECVLWAAKRLAARPETRKVLIVGSDGHPNGAEYGYTEKKYLQNVVQQIINAGIEVYAIGIKSSAVKCYYPHWVTINNTKDLPAVVLRQLGKALLARKGTSYENLEPIRKPNS